MTQSTFNTDECVAAIDLGSNSFHLAVARCEHSQLKLTNALAEKVQLAAGLDHKSNLSNDAQERALSCLSRFRQHLHGLKPNNVRIVGTSALREAKNSAEFISKAEDLLGHPVEIIAGREEARLIYLGVAHSLEDDKRRLVVDIGGGSTEFIIGEKFNSFATESLHMGCIGYTQQFFADGHLNSKIIDKAITAVRLEVQSIKAAYQSLGWQIAVGSSGTIKTIRNIQLLLGLSNSNENITLKGLEKLLQHIESCKHINDIDLPGLKDDRRAIIPAGLCILLGIFLELNIEEMQYSEGALREGVLYDMVGRFNHDDIRIKTIHSLQERYQADLLQAKRVSATAEDFFNQCASHFALNDHDKNLLLWAALVHEIGNAISHNGFHKHGAYIIQHGDMPGFSQKTQQQLALLVLAHRRKIKSETYQQLIQSGGLTLLRLCVLLRLSVLFHHSRSSANLPTITLNTDEMSLSLHIEKAWMDSHPLSLADILQEIEILNSIGIELTLI